MPDFIKHTLGWTAVFVWIGVVCLLSIIAIPGVLFYGVFWCVLSGVAFVLVLAMGCAFLSTL